MNLVGQVMLIATVVGFAAGAALFAAAWAWRRGRAAAAKLQSQILHCDDDPPPLTLARLLGRRGEADPYRGSSDSAAVQVTVTACSTCRFRMGISAHAWRCGAQGGRPCQEAFTSVQAPHTSWCPAWRPRRSRSLLRWLFDVLLAWRPREG